jgi:hypothetical protein
MRTAAVAKPKRAKPSPAHATELRASVCHPPRQQSDSRACVPSGERRATPTLAEAVPVDEMKLAERALQPIAIASGINRARFAH